MARKQSQRPVMGKGHHHHNASAKGSSSTKTSKEALIPTSTPNYGNKLSSLLLRSCSEAATNHENTAAVACNRPQQQQQQQQNLCMFFKLAALYRCRIEKSKNQLVRREAKSIVVECLLDLLKPGRVCQKTLANIPAQYYSLALSALFSCDIDLIQDFARDDSLQSENLTLLMLPFSSKCSEKRLPLLEIAFRTILALQIRLYADDYAGFAAWLLHRDARGCNILHYIAASLNLDCLSALESCLNNMRLYNTWTSDADADDADADFEREPPLAGQHLLAELVNSGDDINGDTPLFYAVQHGMRESRHDNITMLDQLFNLGASLYHLNHKKQTLLMLTLHANKPYLVKPLLQRYVNVPAIPLSTRCRRIFNLLTACDSDGKCSLHYAVQANNTEGARELALAFVMFGSGDDKDLKHVGSALLPRDGRVLQWFSSVRDEIMRPRTNNSSGFNVFSARLLQSRYENRASMQHFNNFHDIIHGRLACAVISHDITHGHSDLRNNAGAGAGGQRISVKVINEEDDVLYPEQIKYEDRDLFPILAADAVRNIKRDKNSKLAANCCDCKGTCVFGYCPCMNAIDYDAYNENGRCRMLSKVKSAKYFYGGAFCFEKGTSPTPPDPTKALLPPPPAVVVPADHQSDVLGEFDAANNNSTTRRSSRRPNITMTSAGNSRKANAAIDDDELLKNNNANGNGNDSNTATKRRSIILPPLIVECGELCQCSKDKCRNRVTQNVARMPRLEVFRSRKCGWGVRTLDPIKPGQYICTMSGLLTRSENVDDPMYCMSLIDVLRTGPHGERVDEKDLPKDDNERDRQFNLDSKDYGNIGRFLNHSCSPNCATTAVLHDEHDLRTPKIALFAMKSIPVLTEITWYYSANYWSGNGGTYGYCRCGANNCQWKHLNKLEAAAASSAAAAAAAAAAVNNSAANALTNSSGGDGGAAPRTGGRFGKKSGGGGARTQLTSKNLEPGERYVTICEPYIDTNLFWSDMNSCTLGEVAAAKAAARAAKAANANAGGGVAATDDDDDALAAAIGAVGSAAAAAELDNHFLQSCSVDKKKRFEKVKQTACTVVAQMEADALENKEANNVKVSAAKYYAGADPMRREVLLQDGGKTMHEYNEADFVKPKKASAAVTAAENNSSGDAAGEGNKKSAAGRRKKRKCY